MGKNCQISLFNITILLLIVLFSCNAYQLFRDPSAGSSRPIKYHILSSPDRYGERMKQYHNTVSQLRLWRRYINDLNYDDDNTLQDNIHQYKSPEYYEH